MRTPVDIMAMSKTYILLFKQKGFSGNFYNLLSSIYSGQWETVRSLCTFLYYPGINVAGDLILIICFKMGVAGAAILRLPLTGYIGASVFGLYDKEGYAFFEQGASASGSLVCAQPDFHRIPMALQFSITAIGTIMVQVALNDAGFHRSGRIPPPAGRKLVTRYSPPWV